MARQTIIADDGTVGVDGEFRLVDLSTLDIEIHAVQFNTSAGVGHVEYRTLGRERNERITDFSPYQQFVDAWIANAPPPPTIPNDKDRTFLNIPDVPNTNTATRDGVNSLIEKFRFLNILE